jgi:hypothetical protein
MTLQTNEETTEATEAPPPKLANGKKEARKEAKEQDADPKPEAKSEPRERDELVGKSGPLSSEMKQLRLNEDRTLREMIESFGTHTAYKIRVTRMKPDTVHVNGKKYATSGYLAWVEGQPIDEAWLQETYGGGKYELMIKKRGTKGGWEYGGQVTVDIAGTPNLDNLPGGQDMGGPPTAAAAPAATSSSESPSVVTKAMDFMAQQVQAAQERADKGGGSGAASEVVDLMREQLAASAREKEALMRRLDEIQTRINQPPVETAEEKFKDRMLDKLIDGDSARITALRTQYESEMRMLKEQAIANEERFRDRAERERQDARNAHEREISLLRQSHDTALAAAKASFETQLAAAKSSFETQVKILEAENRRLERDITDMRDDLKELRAKKDKTIVEQVKELEIIKDALGAGDGEDKDTVEKLMEAAPDVITAVGQMFNKGQQQQAAAAPAQAPPRKREVVQGPDGQKFILEGGKLRPAKKIPPPGTPPEVAALPPIDPAEVNQVVGYLESACQAGTDPSVVVQSFGAYVPETIKVAIRDLGGVDQFLTKVAKLPSSSPLLATQAGRNWVKKLGKALLGE